MKRALIITGITLGSVILIVLIAVITAVYVIFTPARLTPVVRNVAAQYVTCEHEIGEVELTFFSTFPRFGLRANGLLLVNPKAGAQNDTVVMAEQLTVAVDVKQFLNQRTLYVHEAAIENAYVNFFIAPDGSNNLTEVFRSSSEPKEQDTTAFALPFDELRVDGLCITAKAITFVDAKDTIEASLGATELTAKAENWHDMLFALDAQDVCARIKNGRYADHLHLELIAPMAVDLPTMHFATDGLRLAINDYALRLEGDVTIGEVLTTKLAVATAQWQIQPVLALVPEPFTKYIADIDLDGKVQLDATVEGAIGNNRLPRIQAHLNLKDAEGAYKPLPYELRHLALDADADLHLNAGERSTVKIHHLAAQTKQSAISGKGIIDDLLGDMHLNMALKVDANLPDWSYFLPKDMSLSGRAKGTARVKMALSDLTDLRLNKGRIEADLDLSSIHYAMDGMVADLPQTHAVLRLPNPQPSHAKLGWARLELQTSQVDYTMSTPLKVALHESAIQLETGDMIHYDSVLYAAVALQTEQPLAVAMDSMEVHALAPKMTAFAAYNVKDSTIMPLLRATLDCQRLNGFFQEYKADLKDPKLEASISGGRRDKSVPVLRAKLNTTAADVQMGEELIAKSHNALSIEAGARYNAQGENILLQWNPRLNVNLKSGELTMPERLPETVLIPSIEFVYSNREMNIENSRIELGNSDLNIKGNVRNIGKWFRHESILEGELDIVSDHCDANQLLDWFSADKGSEEASNSPKEGSTAERSNSPQDGPTGEADPFLVPTDVSLSLNTHIREVEIFNQIAKDLKGGLYIKDGKLILDEVGFVCRAAKLQLTAIYRTPRRNHIYVGFDYHMIDVDIDELMTMIPNLEEMVPMLSSFKGAAQFHLAAETYMNSQYQPKMSTLRGAASLTGKDLVVMDSKTFDEISKKLLFKKSTENKIDSINAELTVYKNEIDIYPLCISIDNYMVALGGRHKTDMTFDYDINVLKPIYLGVHIGGSMDDLKIKLAKCKYARDFRPHWYQKADNQSIELRRMIKESMEKNVRIQ